MSEISMAGEGTLNPYLRKNGAYSSHEQILSFIKDKGLALDLGSSNGILTHSLLKKGVESICVDTLSPHQVKIPCKSYYQFNLEESEKLQFDEKFDYIILADVVEHLRNGPQLLTNVQKFLKPNGKIIISVPNVVIWVYRLLFLLGKFDYTPKGTLDETHVRFYTLKTFKKLLADTGLRAASFKMTALPFEVVFKAKKPSPFLRGIEWIYYQLTKIWPEMFAYQFVVECQISHPPR